MAFRELGVVALLYSAGSEVVPVQLFDLYRNALLYEAALLGVMMAHVLLGVTVLMATHDLELAASWCDRLIMVNHAVIAYGTPAEALDMRLQVINEKRQRARTIVNDHDEDRFATADKRSRWCARQRKRCRRRRHRFQSPHAPFPGVTEESS